MTIHCTFTIVQGAIKRLLETIFFSFLSKDFFPKFFSDFFQKFFPSVVATFRIVSRLPFTTQSQPNATFTQPQKHKALTPNKKNAFINTPELYAYKNTLFIHFLPPCLLILRFHSSTSNNMQSIYPDKYYARPQQLGDFALLYFVRGELCARSCPRQGYVYLS